MRLFFTLLFVSFSSFVFSQRISGTVYTSLGDLLPYSSITIKGSSKGVSANDKGRYSFLVEPGVYTIVCQHIGFTPVEKKVTIKENTEVDFILTEQKLNLEAVIIKSGGEDPAYEVIRNAIKKRRYYNNQVNSFTCNIYGKDLIKLKSLPKKVFGKKIEEADKKEMGVDSAGKGIVYLSESISKVSVQNNPDKFKLEVLSSRVSGSNGFGFNFPSFVSLYNSNVKIFTERFNPRGFISPIADGAINFYKFKFLGTFFENGKSYNSIKVTPRRLYEPLFTGTINIEDDTWAIHSFDLYLTKTAQLEVMDTLKIVQQHITLNDGVQRVQNQLIHFDFAFFGIKAGGNFLTVYSDYNVKPNFSKKYFDNVVIKYDTAVNKKSIAYWDSARAVPLEKDEERDYVKKDSSFKAFLDSSKSKRYLDSLNKNQQKIKLSNIFLTGINRYKMHKKRNINWGIYPLINPMGSGLEYNPAERITTTLSGYYTVTTLSKESRTSVKFEPLIRYGFGNQHLNPSANLIISNRNEDSLTRKLKRYSLKFSGGKRVSDFNKEGPITPFNNTIMTLLNGNNFLKTYENNFGSITYNKRLENGLLFSTELLVEDRIPLDNTSTFVLRKQFSNKITANYPVEKISQQFTPHQAAIVGFTLTFRPGMRYVQFPNYKVSIGSKYPTLMFNYQKGIQGLLGSDVNFDKWRFSVYDKANLKIAGTLNYKFIVGGFLNAKHVYIQDYQHFNGNQTLFASPYVNSFQLASYYANSTTASIYNIAHLEHHFNGLLTNKIPLFRKLNWNLVAGSNAFYVNKNSNYVEVFGGLENIFKIFRVDFVAGYDRNNKMTTGIRIGSGGLIGFGGASGSAGGNNVSVTL
jgi:hypothetical protein